MQRNQAGLVGKQDVDELVPNILGTAYFDSHALFLYLLEDERICPTVTVFVLTARSFLVKRVSALALPVPLRHLRALLSGGIEFCLGFCQVVIEKVAVRPFNFSQTGTGHFRNLKGRDADH